LEIYLCEGYIHRFLSIYILFRSPLPF
jgi:hypothetical protein